MVRTECVLIECMNYRIGMCLASACFFSLFLRVVSVEKEEDQNEDEDEAGEEEFKEKKKKKRKRESTFAVLICSVIYLRQSWCNTFRKQVTTLASMRVQLASDDVSMATFVPLLFEYITLF